MTGAAVRRKLRPLFIAKKKEIWLIFSIPIDIIYIYIYILDYEFYSRILRGKDK